MGQKNRFFKRQNKSLKKKVQPDRKTDRHMQPILL